MLLLLTYTKKLYGEMLLKLLRLCLLFTVQILSKGRFISKGTSALLSLCVSILLHNEIIGGLLNNETNFNLQMKQNYMPESFIFSSHAKNNT